MKKITLFISLLALMVGMEQVAAQTIVQDFEAAGLGGTFGGASAALAANPSGTGQVAMLSSNTGVGTEVWQGTNISLTQNVRLTTDKTMSMDVYSLTPITIAPKVISGVAGAPDSTTRAEHTGTGWETLTFTFNLGLDGTTTANGDYGAFVIYYNWNTAANTFGTKDSRVFYVDNIKGIAVAAPPAPTPPTVAAPTPPARPSADVVSIYSDAYTSISPINLDAGWCGAGAVAATTAGGNNVLAYKGQNCQGITFPSATQNLTGFTNIHVDFFILAGTNTDGKVFNLKTVALNGAAVEINIDMNLLSPAVVPGTWYSFDRAFTAGELAALAANPVMHEFGVTSNLLNAVWYDNLYIHKNTVLGTASFAKSGIKMYPNPVKNILNIEANSSINKVSVYNILGQEVLTASPKSNSATLQTGDLQRGVYMVTTDIDGNISTSKFLKE